MSVPTLNHPQVAYSISHLVKKIKKCSAKKSDDCI